MKAWFPFSQPGTAAGLRLFCFPFAGGGAGYYRPWVVAPPPGIEVVPVQLPGREQRIGEPAFTRMDDLLDSLLQVLDPLLDRPFGLFGHSMGASIAYALAHRLPPDRAAGLRLLAVSGRRAPGRPRCMPLLHGRDNAGFLEGIRDLGGTPAVVFETPELLDLVMPLLRADFTLVETHPHDPAPRPLSVPLLAFGGTDDPDSCADQIQGWAAMTSGPAAIHVLPGDHFFLTAHRHTVLERVSAALAG